MLCYRLLYRWYQAKKCAIAMKDARVTMGDAQSVDRSNEGFFHLLNGQTTLQQLVHNIISPRTPDSDLTPNVQFIGTTPNKMCLPSAAYDNFYVETSKTKAKNKNYAKFDMRAERYPRILSF